MSFGQDPFVTRIRVIQERLKKLPDDELMLIHEGTYELPEGQKEAALSAALLREVDRRFVAAGWIWRRWFRPGESEKWVAHKKLIEVKATESLIRHFEKNNDPRSQEAVRQLQQRLEELEH